MEFKILTQNLHCLVENNIEKKQKIIVEAIKRKDIDIVFLQEVAQTKTSSIISDKIREDNYGLILKNLLLESGLKYYFYYEPIKESFGIYDEGVAILSKYPLQFIESKFISNITDYSNWKSRKILIYKLCRQDFTCHLGTTHFGWSDEYEVFENQFDLATENISKRDFSILAGDFNTIPGSKEYRHIVDKKWVDLFEFTDYYDKPTFRGDQVSFQKPTRIDYIMTNKKVDLLEKEILFIDDRVSDHFGVYAKINVL